MDGIHDLGGRQGFGPVPRGGDAEVAFTADWQRRVYGLTALGAFAMTNVDAFRHAVECVEPLTYLAGYWVRWLTALESLAEAWAREPRTLAEPGDRTAQRAGDTRRFASGDAVRVRDLHSDGHTRMPGFVRGRRGRVVGDRGVWVYPDDNAHGRGESPCPVYTVRFEAGELWGATAEPRNAVHVDLFEPYLEADT